MTITADTIFANGVVGAGGAGFPTHVKMKAQAEYLILNAAECEPLLHKDKELLLHHAETVLRGMQAAQKLVGAKKAVIGIKEKYQHVIRHLEPLLPPTFEIKPLRDIYPAGDEFVLVYDVTGRVIPPGGLPIHVGCVVNNVETMYNVGLDRPVTHKFITVAGAVREPVSVCVPIGISLGEVIEAAGGATSPDCVALVGGVMMGRIADDLSAPVTKTTGGILLFPPDHTVVRRHRRTPEQVRRIARASCDQCSHCTEMCPRYLLGHPIQPHKAMRAMGFTADKAPQLSGVLYCAECNLCSMLSCPEELDPKNVCVQSKAVAREMGLKWERGNQEIVAHPLNDARRAPIKRLMMKLGLTHFSNQGPLREGVVATSRVRLALKQHVGAPCVPSVTVGSRVSVGDVVARPAEGQLGAVIHASIDGTVTSIDGGVIEVRG